VKSLTSQSESRADNRFQNAGPVEREGYEQLAPPVTAKRTKACCIALEHLRKRIGLVSASQMKGSPVKVLAGGERVFAERDGRGNRHGWEPHFDAGR
jgi:hypothetical protein